jgi:thiol-disulfide isomerase/thioredoxin
MKLFFSPFQFSRFRISPTQISKAGPEMMRIAVAVSMLLASAAASYSASATPHQAVPGSLDGVWIGSAQQNGQQVPFQLEVSGSGEGLHAALINGRQKSPASSVSYADGHLVVHFDYYANTLDATVQGGALTGTFGRVGRIVPVTARLNDDPPAPSPDAPNIAGTWEVSVDGPKGETAWKLQVRQSGAKAEAVIQRIDGDTGSIYGAWRDGQFAVSHFTAAGPSYAVLKPQLDGTLQLQTTGHGGELRTLTARRPQVARSQGLQGPEDPLHHTLLDSPNQPLAFSFPDLNGKIVSNTDPQFRHKVVIVSVGGSWCPNCQDEAPFLEELYRKYHDHGLEIVELSFEEGPQLANPTRLKAVIQKFGITYTVLVAGTPEQLNEKIHGVENLNCWPTTFFVGQDGLVKAIHTGYSGPATGKDNASLEHESQGLVQRLLAGDERSTGVSAAQVAAKQ